MSTFRGLTIFTITRRQFVQSHHDHRDYSFLRSVPSMTRVLNKITCNGLMDKPLARRVVRLFVLPSCKVSLTLHFRTMDPKRVALLHENET